jgi:hypothetical protein
MSNTDLTIKHNTENLKDEKVGSVLLIFLVFCVVFFGGVRVDHLLSFLCCVFGEVRVAHLFSFLCCVFW